MIYDGIATADLPIYLTGLANPFQLVEDYGSDDVDSLGQRIPGWSIIVDVDRVPDEAVPWLAQCAGVRVTTGLSVADQRLQLSGLSSWKRGTVAALQAAPAPYLTGGKTVIIKERDTSPYHFEVITYASETPDDVAVLAALLTQKPASLIMVYTVFSGQKAFTVRDSTIRGTVPDSLRLVI